MKNQVINLRKSQVALACAAVLSVNSFAVYANEGATSIAVEDQGNNKKNLEIISVVGHKLTELNEENNGGSLGKRTLLETPFSVDVISLQDMEIRQVNTLDSLFSREASVSVDGSAYSSFGDTVRVRGLALDYTESFKVNGMAINSFSGELPYEAFEQVTLIKGATGFMYGMAAPGGVINYVTKRAKEDSVSVDLGMRSDSVFSSHIDASTRMGEDDDYGLRVNLVKEKGDTYLDNGAIDRETASVAFDAHLTDALYWSADLIYSDRYVESSWTRFTSQLDESDTLPDTVDGSRNLGVPGSFDEYKNIIALTSLHWQINDNWSARLDYDYSKNETKWVKTLAYLQNSAGDLDLRIYEQYFNVDYNQVQATINGSIDTGSFNHSLVMGISQQEATTYRNDAGQYGRNVVFNYATDNLFDPQEVPTFTPSLQEDAALAWKDSQTSYFISDFISINEHWEALVGIRANEIEHTPSEYFSSHDNYKDTAVSPTYALMYKPDENTTFYASYVESFEGQTSTVGEDYANADELLEPLESLQYELGMKTAGDGWSVTSALFRIERGATLVTDDNYFVQEGVTLYQGLEFSGALDVTENLSLYGDLMLLDTEYDKTDLGYDGNDVGGAPKQQFSLQTNYNVAAVPGLTLNLGGKYHGGAAVDSANNWEIPSYTLVYGGASYNTQFNDQKLTLIATIDNLFDKEYWAVGDSYGGLRIGEPRTFAVKVKMNF